MAFAGHETNGSFGALTATYTTLPPNLFAGMVRRNKDNTYVLMQAGAAILVNEAVQIDTAVTTCLKVKKTAAVTDHVFGTAETAIASGDYGWITRHGKASTLVANGVAANDPLAAGASGTLAKPANTDVAPMRSQAIEANSSGGTLAKIVALL
jgi:hypothetical protein